MSNIFISYSHEDKVFANKLANDLQKKSIKVWIDEGEILVGDSLIEKIQDGISQMDYVGVILTPNSVKSRWVKVEVAMALNQEIKGKRIKVLPILAKKCQIPEHLKIKKWADCVGKGYSKGLSEILKRLTKTKEKDPDRLFLRSYHEWKAEGFLPGGDKVEFFMDNLKKIRLNISKCEFLLRSLTVYYDEDLSRKIETINKMTLFKASIRLLKDNNPYIRYMGIRFSVFINPKKTEPHLWRIYQTDSDLGIRTEALKHMWRCKSNRALKESYSVILNNPEWPLREAAAINIGRGQKNKEVIKILSQALRDGRYQVRGEVAYAIARLKIKELVPELIKAIYRERSRKGKGILLQGLWYFKDHPKVRALRKQHEFPRGFDKNPDFKALYIDDKDELLF